MRYPSPCILMITFLSPPHLHTTPQSKDLKNKSKTPLPWLRRNGGNSWDARMAKSFRNSQNASTKIKDIFYYHKVEQNVVSTKGNCSSNGIHSTQSTNISFFSRILKRNIDRFPYGLLRMLQLSKPGWKQVKENEVQWTLHNSNVSLTRTIFLARCTNKLQ